MRTWTIRELLDRLITQFENNKISSPKQNAETIISHILKMKRLDIYLHLKNEMSETELNSILLITERRKKCEPLQYILGETEFYGYKFKVNKSVLIPRPETELLVEKIIKEENNVNSILEIGTGSGAIVIALKKHFQNSIVLASDVSKDALKTAAENAVLNSVQLEFVKSDIFENIAGRFDLIISNPPYISPDEYEQLPIEIRDHEPKSALQAENNGLYYYEKILQNAKEHLTKSGKIYFEIGYDQAEKIADIAKENGFSKIKVFKDLNGFDRIMRII